MKKEDVIAKLRTSEFIFYTNSPATNHPFVECDQESYNDQVWLFADEAGARTYFEEKKEEKIPVQGARIATEHLGQLYYELHTIGVNSVVWVENGENFEVELDEVAPMPEYSEEEREHIPPMNPALQLSGIYFMQEMRRPVEKEEHAKNNAFLLEEEFLANICKSNFFMPMRQESEDAKPSALYIEHDGKMYMPFFTDTLEMNTHVGLGVPMRIALVPFDKIAEILPQQMEGIILNPKGFNLILTRKQLEELKGE